MKPENRVGRLAGVLYLIVVLTGLFSLLYVPSKIFVDGDPAATMQRIVESESLLRAGFASFVVKQIAFVLLPLALFVLLRRAGEQAAVAMVALALVSVPMALVALSHRMDALALLTDEFYSTSLSPEALRATAQLALDGYGHGLLLTTLFWGLWLLPLGLLVVRSGFLPKFLGYALMLGCFGYLLNGLGEILSPGYGASTVASISSIPSAVGEIGLCFWLLFGRVAPRGAAIDRTPAQSAPSATR